jgi:hypothetical protein
MPPYRREIPAWSAASWKVLQRSVTALAGVIPGSIMDAPYLIPLQERPAADRDLYERSRYLVELL